MLYAFGSNGSAQLGLGHTEDQNEPQKVLVDNSDTSWGVTQLAAGGNHTILLCDDGKVRVMGNNEDGRCGMKGIAQLDRPTEMPLPIIDSTGKPVEVKQIAASWSSTALLTAEGEVYVCGTGNAGELGLGFGIMTASTLQRVPNFVSRGSQITTLAAGMGHTIVTLSNGEVYGWGKGRQGQLGEPQQNYWEPRQIADVGLFVVQAVCGREFTMLLDAPVTRSFTVLGPGKGDKFGIAADGPTLISGWKKVAASWGGIYVLKTNGETLSWGRNDHGQLASSRLDAIEDLAAGSEHCLALTYEGKVLAWGWGEHGNCGLPLDDNGDVKGIWNEVKVAGRAVRVFAGCATSFIEVEEP